MNTLPDFEFFQAIWQAEQAQLKEAIFYLNHSDPMVQIRAMERIVIHQSQAAIPAVLPLLAHENQTVSKQAFETLARLQAHSALADIVKHITRRPLHDIPLYDFSLFEVQDWLPHWPPEIPLPEVPLPDKLNPELTAQWYLYLNLPDDTCCTNALKLIGGMLSQQEPQRLLNFLKHPGLQVRLQAIPLVLNACRQGSLDSASVFRDFLAPLLHDRHPEIRFAACHAMGQLLYETGERFYFHHWEWESLQQKFEQHRFQSVFLPLLSDPDLSIRLLALEFVCPQNVQQAREALEGLFCQNGPITVSDNLLSALDHWPMEFHSILKVLVNPCFPIRPLHRWLNLLNLTHTQKNRDLSRVFSFPSVGGCCRCH